MKTRRQIVDELALLAGLEARMEAGSELQMEINVTGRSLAWAAGLDKQRPSQYYVKRITERLNAFKPSTTDAHTNDPITVWQQMADKIRRQVAKWGATHE